MKRTATTDALNAAGYKAAADNKPRACALCAVYMKAVAGLEVGDPMSRVYANAWYFGYTKKVDADCAELA